MSSAFHALITDFVSGRVSYDNLSKQIRSDANQSPEALREARETIRGFVELGRLPQDLGQILLSLLPATPPTGASAARADDDTQTAAAAEPLAAQEPYVDDEDFDEPTLPHLTGPVRLYTGPPETIGNAQVRAMAGETAPHLPPLPFLTQPATAAGEEMREKVDDAILSSLVSGFSDFRSQRASGDQPRSGQPAAGGKLDRFLTDFKSVRYRSDARRMSSGKTREGLDVNSFATPQTRRAGVGSILRDRFILDTEIGRGGMGQVYSAVDRRRLEAGHDQPYVAIKLLNESFHDDSEALKLMEAEARKSQTLAHPNITSVYDFDRDKADVFIVMELLKGIGLDRRLSQSLSQPLPTGESARILKAMCEGLSHAHSRGVVHSDLKPGNIFVLQDGTVKLLDFGLAAVASASADHPIQDSLTAAYASPEQFERAPRDPRDDIFALGCIAYQLLTGRHPFGNRPTADAARAGETPRPIEGLDRQAWETILMAMAFDREQRLADVNRFLSGLFDEQSD